MDCDWQEIGTEQTVLPQLGFSVAQDKMASAYHYRVPGGCLERAAQMQNVPSLGTVETDGIALFCDSTYGFRGEGRTMRVSLIRGASNPDPIPESGSIRCRVAVSVSHDAEREYLQWSRELDVVPVARIWVRFVGA
jgi:hypothetical protein